MEAKIYFHTADAKVGIMQENQHNFIVIAGDISRTHLDRGCRWFAVPIQQITELIID